MPARLADEAGLATWPRRPLIKHKRASVSVSAVRVAAHITLSGAAQAETQTAEFSFITEDGARTLATAISGIQSSLITM
jgi:hypothetical protein